MSRLLGDEYPAFVAALGEESVSGLRVNTLKVLVEEFTRLSSFPLGGKVPWCDSAFIVSPASFSFGLHPYHLAGLFYLQDPSAMSPAEMMIPQPGERILDLAAAPGGKTTHLASLMKGGGLLVANEIKTKRVGHLAMNMERWGADNVVITNETPERLADHFGAFFDRVLVDAPCSGEGMFRKDMGARADWSPGMVQGCAARQKNILRIAAKLVRPGGYLLYSTCTFAPEENECVIEGFLSRQTDGVDFKILELPLLEGCMRGRPDWVDENTKNKKQRESLRGAVRLFPHRVKGVGNLVCLLQKTTDSEPDGWIQLNGKADWLKGPTREQAMVWRGFSGAVLAADFPEERLRVRGERLYLVPVEMPDFDHLRVIHSGVWLGTFKKGRFEPAHPLALYLRKGQAKNPLALSIGSRELAAYLRGESLPSDGMPGWVLVCVEGFPLGWGKRVQGVVKNHYPRGWIIYSKLSRQPDL